ncbi:MAG: GntR family transcriptional regulator [Actinobacteria bacterium]|nr:GntR family transcriptional regulator [Actinomycetota bacterium]
MNEQPMTPSRQIATDLRTAIRSGEYRPGHQLPSGSALAKRYDVARPTVQRAIDLLRAEGLIVGHAGAGWFVREQPVAIRVASTRLRRSEREAGRGASVSDAAQGAWTVTAETTVHFESACERTATELRIEPGDEITVRERVIHADGHPVQLSTSRLPRAITRGTAIERKNTGPGGTYARLEEAGRTLGRFEERVTARLATAEEVAALRLNPGSPVLAITRIAYETSGDPVEINDMVLTGERYELIYDVSAE